jgi:hypothetical protein
VTAPEVASLVLETGLPADPAAAEPAGAEALVLCERAVELEPQLLAQLLAALEDPNLAAAVADLGDGVQALAMRRSDADLLQATVAAPGRALAALRTALTGRGRVETVASA